MESSTAGKPLKAVIFGDGPLGVKLTETLLESDKWSEVLVVGRRELPEWATYATFKDMNCKKLRFQRNVENWDITGYSTLFCVQPKTTIETFEKFRAEEYDHVLEAATKAQEAGIPHLSLYSAHKADPAQEHIKGLKLLGETVDALEDLKFKTYSVFQAGSFDDDPRDGGFV